MGDCRPEYARLCRLIIDSLQSYNKPQSLSPLTDERERHLLIILTKVSREIQGWDDVFDGEHSMGKEKSCHDCLNNIVLILVIFLGDESKYIRHSSSNVFVAISDYLLKSGSNWDGFLQLLCISLKVSATNILTSSSISSKTQTVGSDSDTISFILSVQQRLMTHANWFTVIGLVRVLRTILKHVRDENGDGDDLAEKYIDSIGICLGSIPWGLMSGQTMNSSMDVFHHGEFASQDTRFVFLGALLQLLCSLIGESSFAEAEDSTINKHPIFDTIITFVPELLYCCFHKEDGYDEVHSSQYLRHKMLVLMTRLSSQNHLESSILVLWLQLVRKYFEDLINQPISRHHANLSDCLEGSPFLACVSDGEFHSICTRHLQRQAIFIFLKLSLSLFSAGKDIDLRCSYATSSSSLTIDSQSALKCCTRKKGLSELSAWLERHLPMETLADFEMYLEKCANFASSFLQLFLEEDDFLFEVLLLLSKFPFFVQQMEFKSYRQAFEEAKENIMLHLSNILDPIHLFHIFLAEVSLITSPPWIRFILL
ncbi:hypothetical protein GIB67_015918 [Kingdonia uniflora]|uniref:Uncharacterized protein n=1 Tax=Kingdonia uniflora TaxID=39325 RepID=A0A7J7PCG8_9MAGN|nr:hypothetical protein GIB67_015918 [Kingdonia uniflora]